MNDNLAISNMAEAFDRFCAIHLLNDGKPFVRFTDSECFVYKEEQYKEEVLYSGRKAIRERSGSLLGAVIDAIEQKQNNLLKWPALYGGEASRVHRPLLLARDAGTNREELESVFSHLYGKRQADEDVFNDLLRLCGKRYELLAFLFSVADPTRFLPVRVKTFEKFFGYIGTPYAMSGKCSWLNYAGYLQRMRAVEEWLRFEAGVPDVNLLHAHSFAWVVARKCIDNWQGQLPAIEVREFSGTLLDAKIADAFIATETAPRVDVKRLAENKMRAGARAETIALAAERQRLSAAGRPDLAERARLESDRIALGYDIRSYEVDDSERLIEVKNVSSAKRFFLSANELGVCSTKENSWLYLVDLSSSRHTVTMLRGTQLMREHLEPVVWRLRFENSE